jgi:hypothetical protein
MHRDETQCRPTPAAQSPATMACMAFPSRKPSPTLNESVVRGPFHPFFPYHRPFPITFSSAICYPHCGHCHWTPDAGFVACLRNGSDRLVRLRAILTLCRPSLTQPTPAESTRPISPHMILPSSVPSSAPSSPPSASRYGDRLTFFGSKLCGAPFCPLF